MGKLKGITPTLPGRCVRNLKNVVLYVTGQKLCEKRQRNQFILWMFHHMQLDLIDFRTTPGGPNNEYRYVAHLIDHFSCYHFTRPIKYKNAPTILKFLKDKFSMIGYPRKLHTDNGSEFVNGTVRDYLDRHGIEYVTGKPYHPQTQGKIERANRYLQELMDALIAQSNYKDTWYDVVYEATFATNINGTCVLKKSAYDHPIVIINPRCLH